MPSTPLVRADSPFLTDLLESMRKRGKSLRHRFTALDVERILEIRDGIALERIEIDCLMRPSRSIRLVTWDDRALWVWAGEATKNAGWRFEYSDNGRLTAPNGGRELVAAIQASADLLYDPITEAPARLTHLWAPLLAKGPTAAS